MAAQLEYGSREEYVEGMEELVELERREEMRRHEEEIKNLSGREREDEGRALTDMTASDEGEGLGGHLVKFTKVRNDPLPDNEISVGDLVMVSRDDPLRDDNPTGTVTEKTGYSITVAFDPKPGGFIYSKGVRLDLYVNDITYQRMLGALEEMEKADGRLAALRDVITGDRDPEESQEAEVSEWYNPQLNSSQKRAVKRAIGSDDFHLIHGPPGTGKTTTAVEVIEQLVAEGESVLATADSNTAVDNILEFLVEGGIQAVRVGHPARVTETLRQHTLDVVVEDNPKYRESQELRERAFELKEDQEDLTFPSGRYRRGMSDQKIKELAEEGRGSRGVSPEKIQEMADWLEMEGEIDGLFGEADRLREEAIGEVVEKMDVVCTTNSTAGSELLAGRDFDVVVIDEATQATEPSCLIPITSADEVIMAGDHRQLPPTVQSREASEGGLDYTLFEKLAEEHEERILDMLRIQYRMHRDIMDFPADEFYGGELEADDSVRTHTLSDLDFDVNEIEEELKTALDPTEPVVFIDTAREDAPERARPGSTSKENPREAELATDLADNCLDAGMDPEDVAVISPYDDQVDRMRGILKVEGLEVDTIDGFQGREKEVVIISLVRSNDREEMGFLRDVRRLNVALTRAKRKLIVIGDGSTVSSHPVYQRFIAYAGNEGLHLHSEDLHH